MMSETGHIWEGAIRNLDPNDENRLEEWWCTRCGVRSPVDDPDTLDNWRREEAPDCGQTAYETHDWSHYSKDDHEVTICHDCRTVLMPGDLVSMVERCTKEEDDLEKAEPLARVADALEALVLQRQTDALAEAQALKRIITALEGIDGRLDRLNNAG